MIIIGLHHAAVLTLTPALGTSNPANANAPQYLLLQSHAKVRLMAFMVLGPSTPSSFTAWLVPAWFTQWTRQAPLPELQSYF